MAKLKKFPKLPSARASLDTIKNAEKRFAEVKKHNDAIKKEKATKAAARKKLADMKKK
ncbi:hypothetical protein GCM10027347_58680 [Larkinella harenae]